MNLSFITFQHWDDILYSFWLYSNIKSTVWVLFSCLNDEFYHWSFCLVVFCFQIDVMRSISVSFDSVNLVFSDRQDSQFVTPVGRRQTTWSRTSLRQSNHTIEVWCRGEFSSLKPVSICKFAPTRKKKKTSAHITVCKKSVASEQSETSQSPPTGSGNCLVPKLNWRMHCNSNCFCLSVSFFFPYLLCYWAIKCMLKGKVR